MVNIVDTNLGEGTHTAYVTFTDDCSPANVYIRQLDLVLSAPTMVTMDTVPVLDPGNDADTRYATPGYGSVGYNYLMGRFEVTSEQYCAFLNAVAKTDTYGLYHTWMATDEYADSGILRFGTSGNYSYKMAAPPHEVKISRAQRPVAFVSWGDAARFVNWLHNGQPTGAQNAATTEDGAYTLNGATSEVALNAITRNAGATWVIPNEDEWYKAAYYSPVLGTGGYWDFPTQSNTINTSMASYNKDSWAAPEYVNSYGYPSYYGTKDQGGNILEWIESAFASNQRVNRGGMYYSPESELKASYRKGENPETSHLRYLGFRVANLDMDLGDPKQIYPNDDTTVRDTTNYNNTHPCGLFVKRDGDVSYIEFTFGITHVNSAKLVLWQDNPNLNAGSTIVIRGDEYDFDEATFNNSSLGDTWPLLGTLAVSGVAPVQAFYEFDITDWYNDNLGKRMSLFLRNDGTWNEQQSPIFEDREGTRTGDPITYGPRIELDSLNCNTPWADADGDGDVDMDDFALFQRCFSGNDLLPVDADEYCRCFDRNLDGKVNNTDLAAFEACSTGPGVQWVSSPACP